MAMREVMYKPDFERDRMEGQLNPEERELLYNTVLDLKPQYCVESGTFKGGGSTYFIATALANIDEWGILHTIEMKQEFLYYAQRLYQYELKHLADFVHFHKGNSLDVLRYLGYMLPRVDFMMLDGGASCHKILYDFALIRDRIPVGGIVAVHDWLGEKCQLIKPVLESDPDFVKIDQVIELAMFRRIGSNLRKS